MTGWTAFAELDEVLDDLRRRVRQILGTGYVGSYLQGSFALGAGDAQSDADFIVVTSDAPSGAAEAGLRALHDELPGRPGIWHLNLEGSYADATSLSDPTGLDVPWLFNNRGHRTLEWDTHCNNLYTRWILRNHGIVLDGPPPDQLVADVPPDALKRAALVDLPGVLADLESWADMGNAWSQKYLVQTVSRLLYTASTGRVASKPQALTWAVATLDPRWRPLLAQVAEDRDRPWHPVDPPRPGSVERAKEYAAYAQDLAQRSVS